MKTKFSPTPSECPVCGAEVPPQARTCPECGADERSGWNEESAVYGGLDLPTETSSYDEILKDEGLKPRYKPKGVATIWWLAGALLLAVLIFYALGFRF